MISGLAYFICALVCLVMASIQAMHGNAEGCWRFVVMDLLCLVLSNQCQIKDQLHEFRQGD